MATRRKCKKPQGYRDGGRVRDDVVIPHHAAPSDPTPPAPKPAAAVAEDSPLQRAIAAQLRAEELQRRRDRSSQRSSNTSAASRTCTEHKRRFLKGNPEPLLPSHVPVMSRHYQEALTAGIADDTPEMDQHIKNGVGHHMVGTAHARAAAGERDQGARNVQARIQAITALLLQYPLSGQLTSESGLRRILTPPYPI